MKALTAPVADNDTSKDLGDLVAVCDALLTHLQMPKAEITTMQTCLKELVTISQHLGQQWRISSFGSAASGFYTRFSDLDVTCYQLGDDRLNARDSLTKLHPHVHEHANFEVTEVIAAARIPLLKMRYGLKLDVDVSFQNTEPLPNTQLLRAYARLSTIIRHLVILIKVWAKAEGVCGAQDGHLSSYSFTLMTLYFLQVDPMVKLPCFPTAVFTGHKHIPPEADITWECTLPLPALVCRFFEFYTTSFHWGYEVVSCRTGGRLYSSNPTYRQLAGRDGTSMIHIEDPFLLNRNLNCVLGTEQYMRLYQKMNSAHRLIQMGSAPDGFRIALTLCHEKSSQLEKQAPSAPPGFTEKAVKPSDQRRPANTNGTAQKHQEEAVPRGPAPAPDEVPMTALFKNFKIKA